MQSRLIRLAMLIPIALVVASIVVWGWWMFRVDSTRPKGPKLEVDSAPVGGVTFEIQHRAGLDDYTPVWGAESLTVHRGKEFLDYADGVLVVNGKGFPSPKPGEVVRWNLEGALLIDGRPQSPHPLQPRPLTAPGTALRWELRGGSDAPRDTLSVDWSRSGRLLLAANGDGSARLWDPDQPAIRMLFSPDPPKGGRGRWGLRGAISPDGKIVATANLQAESVTLWDVATGAKLAVLSEPPGKVTEIAFATVGWLLEARGGTLYVRDLTGDRTRVIPLGQVHSEFTPPFAIAPGSGTIARNDGHRVIVNRPSALGRPGEAVPLDVPESPVVIEKVTDEGSVALSVDGKLVAVFDGTSRLGVYDAKTGSLRTRLRWRKLQDRQAEPMQIGGMAFFPDGKTLAVGSIDSIRFYDLETGREWGILPSEWVRQLAISADGKTLAAALRYREGVHLWETAELVAK